MARVAEGLSANRNRVQRFTVLVPCKLVKLAFLLDGLGIGGGSQVVKPVVYTAAGALVAVGDETTVARGRPLGWMDFRFASGYPGGVRLAPGDYDFGLIAGATSISIQLYTDGTATGKFTSDIYSDGPADPYGSNPTVWNNALVMQPAYVHDWVVPDVDDLQLARLPFNESQEVFSTTGPIEGSLRVADAGWFGTRLDPERGAVAVVGSGGLLVDLVGERLKITNDEWLAPRVVYLYCHNEATLNPGEDIAFPPGIFVRLGVLSRVTIPVRAEVLG